MSQNCLVTFQFPICYTLNLPIRFTGLKYSKFIHRIIQSKNPPTATKKNLHEMRLIFFFTKPFVCVHNNKASEIIKIKKQQQLIILNALSKFGFWDTVVVRSVWLHFQLVEKNWMWRTFLETNRLCVLCKCIFCTFQIRYRTSVSTTNPMYFSLEYNIMCHQNFRRF